MENRKSPEQIKADVSRIIIAKSEDLKHWMEIPDEKVKEIKDALKKALDLPASEQISIAIYDTGRDTGVLFSVQSSTNPLRRYLYAHRMGNGEIGMMEFNLPSGHTKTNVQNVINELFTKTLNIPRETKVDFAYQDIGNGITRHTIIDQASGAILGTIDVNEKTATIIRSQRNETAIEAAKPKNLKESMTLLAKEGRTRNPLVRKTVEEALRKELQLPDQFSDRALLITAKQEGRYVEITVEDKGK